eukprot:GHVS01053308.1.p1 GENE.GHVS01053308.1~~GHVS01053308.1.p1  ORF type:complete len:554 (+),score=99.14 GHVS01053308.1:17-1678(+)
MGANASSTADHPGSRWVLENILFFRPDCLFEDKKDERRLGDDVSSSTTSDGRSPVVLLSTSRVQRFAPTSSRVRSRDFVVLFELQGTRREFVLRLLNYPNCAVVVCAKAGGEELRRIPANKVEYFEREDLQVEAVFVVKKKKGEGDDRASLRFRFEDKRECDSFCDSVRRLYGITVKTFGFREDKQEGGGEDEATTDMACPIHGDIPCRCVIEKRRADDYDSEDAGAEDAEYSEQFPISIEGKCEIGADLRYKDLSVVGRRLPGRIVQWFVARQPGKDPTFAVTPTKTSPVFQPSDSAAGRFVKVRVARRMESGPDVGEYLYSEGVKGPITVDDLMAKQLLEVIGQAAVPVDISCEPTAAMILLAQPKQKFLFKEDRIQGQLWILRQGIVFRVAGIELIERSYAWENFYVTRHQDEEVDVVVFHLPDVGDHEYKCKVSCPNEGQRNLLYHIIIFYKLSSSFGDFQRWMHDLDVGNYTTLKYRYSRNWSNTTWEKYKVLAAKSEDAATTTTTTGVAFEEASVRREAKFAEPQVAEPREDHASDEWGSSDEDRTA